MAHKHSVIHIEVAFEVPRHNPNAHDLHNVDTASKFANMFQNKFGTRGVRDVMVFKDDNTRSLVCMKLYPYTKEDPDSPTGQKETLFTKEGLDMYFNNFYNNFPFFK